jgi:hypothetical protein
LSCVRKEGIGEALRWEQSRGVSISKRVGVKRVFGGVEVNARIVNFEVLASASQIDCFEALFGVL